MPSYNQQQLNYIAQNANGCKVMIGAVVVAYAQTATPTWDMGAQQLYGIGSPNPQEIQQLRNSPSISVEFMELTAQGITLLGTGSRLVYTLGNTQTDISIIDSTGAPIFTYVGCVANTDSITITTNQVLLETVSFLAMDILNASGDSILNSNAVYSIPSLIAGSTSQGTLGVQSP